MTSYCKYLFVLLLSLLFSGKASAIVKSLISGEWWRSDPTTGFLPETVERNHQFFINQGPVDVSIKNARSTSNFLTLDSVPSLIGTYLPRQLDRTSLSVVAQPHDYEQDFKEEYLWHPFTKQTEPFIEFSIVPTKY